MKLSYYARHRKKILEYNKRYREENKKQVTLYERRYNTVRRYKWRVLRENLFHLLGHVCVACGEHDKRCLEFDHMGAADRMVYPGPGGAMKYRYWLNNPELAKKTLQVLCANCNKKKRYEKQEDHLYLRL